MNISTSISSALFCFFILGTTVQSFAHDVLPNNQVTVFGGDNQVRQGQVDFYFASNYTKQERSEEDYAFLAFDKDWDCQLLSQESLEMPTIQVVIETKDANQMLAPVGEAPKKHKMTLTEAIWQIEEVGNGAQY